MTALAGEGNQIFVTTIVAANTGKAVLQTAAIKVAKDGKPDLRSQIPQTGLIPIFMHPLQLLEKVLDTAVMRVKFAITSLRISHNILSLIDTL